LFSDDVADGSDLPTAAIPHWRGEGLERAQLNRFCALHRCPLSDDVEWQASNEIGALPLIKCISSIELGAFQ